MQRQEPLRIDMQPTLGAGHVFGVHYIAGDPSVREDAAPRSPEPLALAEMPAQLSAIHLALQQIARKDYQLPEELITAVHTIAYAQRDTAIAVGDVYAEVSALRADLKSRTFAARCRRAWAWLKGLFA